MLRAESLYYGSVALPQHPNAAKWRRMAETLAGDSLGHWEIEDASGYQAIWLYALFSYAEISGRPEYTNRFRSGITSTTSFNC